MYLEKIKYENFRNLKDNSLTFCNGVNVIYGENAQGKTNIAEAIWMITGQKSFRTSVDKQLINKDSEKEFAKIEAEFFSGKREQKAILEFNPRRKANLNGVALKSCAELSKAFGAVVFSPNEMQLINDGPQIRRKFLDNAISIIRPKYNQALSSYNRAVLQRNVLLKDVQFHSELEPMLDSFEEKIAQNGAYIISQRIKYVNALMNFLPEIYSGISSNREQLCVKYGQDDNDDIKLNYENLIKNLKASRFEDMKTCVTSVGPHRDDLFIYLNDDSIRTYGSQGQKRSAVLSLKLSEAEILKKHSGEQPITILDDVMSELDKSRQDYILNHIKGWQVFITCCDNSSVDILKDGKCFLVENGVAVEQ